MNTTENIQVLPESKATRMPFEWGHLTWFANNELGNCKKMTLGRCVINPGHSNHRHYHPNCTEVLIVISGKISHTLADNKEVEMNPGDTVTIPANVWHCARNIGDTEAVLFIAFDSADRKTVGE